MKFNDIQNEEKVRLDPKCWKGKKIGNPKTKMKGGVRVNNCVPAESVGEAANPAQQAAIAIAKKKKKQGIAEGSMSDLRRAVYQIILDIHFGAKYGDEMIDTVTDELGDYFDDVQASGDPVLQKVYAYVRQEGAEAEGDPARMDRVALNAIEFLNYEGARGNLNEFAPGMAEDFNGEYDDEAGMADNNLETLKRTVAGIDELIDSGDNLPEWCQEKIAVAKSMLVNVWDYMYSEEASDEVDPEVDAMFEAVDRLAHAMARRSGVDVELVWESFEALPDHVLWETAQYHLQQLNEDWQKVNKQDKTDGMSRKAVKAYRRENPGSKLKTAVTTKPSKLKKGGKAAKRRKSFCARMRGMKKSRASAKTKRNPNSPINKALRRWNC